MYSGLDLALALAPLYFSDDTLQLEYYVGVRIFRPKAKRDRAAYFRAYRKRMSPLQKAAQLLYQREHYKKNKCAP